MTLDDFTEARGLLELWVCDETPDADIMCSDGPVAAARLELVYVVAETIAALPKPRQWLAVAPIGTPLPKVIRPRCNTDTECARREMAKLSAQWANAALIEKKPIPESRPTFDCPDPSSRQRIAICSDANAGDAEKLLSRQLANARKKLLDLGIYDALGQEAWEARGISFCGADKGCISATYRARAEEIAVFMTRNRDRFERLETEQKQARRTAQREERLAAEERFAARPIVDPAPGFDESVLPPYLTHIYRGHFDLAEAALPQRDLRRDAYVIRLLAAYARRCEASIPIAQATFKMLARGGDVLSAFSYSVPGDYKIPFELAFLGLNRNKPGQQPGPATLGAAAQSELDGLGCGTPQADILFHNLIRFGRRNVSLQEFNLVPSAFGIACTRHLPDAYSSEPATDCRCVDRKLTEDQRALRQSLAAEFTAQTVQRALNENAAFAEAFAQCEMAG